MMIARIDSNDDEKPILLLGLSRKNIEKLIEGLPIKITRKRHGSVIPEGMEIGIIFGETEADMRKTLVEMGVIGQKTTVTTDPRLRDEGPKV